MTEIKTNAIPHRLKNVNKEHPYVSGAKDIYDDDLGMTQNQINSIVIGGAISIDFSASPVLTIGTSANVSLNATSNNPADIAIKKNNTILASGSSRTSLNATDENVNIALGSTIEYVAEFAFGAVPRAITLKPIFFGAGATYNAVTKAAFKKSPAGTYSVPVAESETSVWFVVPASMSINRATMSGFDFPLKTPQSVTIEGVAYKAYESSNTYDAGTLTIVIS